MSTRDSEMTGNTSALALFRNRPFALLWLSQMISNLGDMALYIVLPVTVYKATGSKSELAITFVCGTLPALLFSLLGGVLADRWPQRRTMIAADLARMAALLLLLLVHNVKHFGPHDLLLFYTVSFLVASFSCFFSPARQSLMRIAVPKEQLLQANSLVFTGSQGCSLLGPAVGGLLLAFLSAKSVFVFDAATFAVSALLIALVQVPLSALQDRPTKPRRGPAGVWEDAREGISYITKSQILRPALTLILFAAASSQITNTLEFPFVRDVWHGSAGQYAALVSIGYAAAVLTGAAGAGPLRSVAPARLLLIGFLIMGVTGLFFAWTTGLVVGGALLFVSCTGNSILNIGNITLFQRSAPPHIQGRVSATISLCMKMALTAGGLLTVALSSIAHGPHGLRLIFMGVAAMYFFCALLAWVTLGHLSAQDVNDALQPPDEPPAPGSPPAVSEHAESSRA